MEQTKEQLLQSFAGMDVSTLQKLQKYANLLIIPEEDLLTNATMTQMVDKAHRLADSLFPEWTDRSKSDFGEFLVEIFALFSEKDFWYINAFANESILRKMRSYSNAFSKASSMGYSPVTCKASSADFSVVFAAGEEVTYKRGDLILSVGGKQFTNDNEFTVAAAATDTTLSLNLSEGNQNADDVTYNGYNLFIRKEGIDVSSLRVIIDNIIYTQVRNFGLSSADSNHFLVLPEEDGSVSVYFGSGGYGVNPPIGKNIRVEYRKCSGSEGNVPIQSVLVADSLPERNATSAQMLTAATGGTDAESLDSIKEKAPLYFKNKTSAVNETVSQEIINGFPFVHKSKVTLSGRNVVFQVIPTSGYLEPLNEEVETILREFGPYVMAGYTPVYSRNAYKSLLYAANAAAESIILDVVIAPGYSKTSVEASLRQIMDDLTNPLISADYGKGFTKSSADLLMRASIPGIQSVSFKNKVAYTEVVMPDVELLPNEIFRKINQDQLTVRINVY